MIAAEMMPNTNLEMSSRTSTHKSKEPTCYSLTIFTKKWKEVRNFYTDVLKAKVLSERTNRYCDLILGGLPISLRPCDMGEDVSYFHVYLALREREDILDTMREQGVIVTLEGPYANFRDPEGRVFKLSESEAILS